MEFMKKEIELSDRGSKKDEFRFKRRWYAGPCLNKLRLKVYIRRVFGLPFFLQPLLEELHPPFLYTRNLSILSLYLRLSSLY